MNTKFLSLICLLIVISCKDKVISPIDSSSKKTSGDPAFISNYMVDASFKELNRKWRNGFQKNECPPRTVKSCNTLYKGQCDCYELKLALTRYKNHTLYVTSFQDKVVEYIDDQTANAQMLPPAKVFFGDDKPTAVYLTKKENYYYAYSLVYTPIQGTAFGQVFCPTEIYGGKKVMNTPLRDCHLTRAIISRFEKLEEDPKTLVKDFNY